MTDFGHGREGFRGRVSLLGNKGEVSDAAFEVTDADEDSADTRSCVIMKIRTD